MLTLMVVSPLFTLLLCLPYAPLLTLISQNVAKDLSRLKRAAVDSDRLWKEAAGSITLQRGPVDPKFQVEGVAPHQPFFFSEN